jgi:hypothetical protein
VKPFAVLAAVALTAGCIGEAPEPQPESTEIPEEVARQAPPPPQAADMIGSPMKDRVATLALLNKRNNLSRDIEMKPGEARRIGDVVIRLSACERTAPWEDPPETGAFVQVVVHERKDAGSPLEWRRIFSGWLFKNSPSLNVVEHPIYDVWVKDCKMTFPEGGAQLRTGTPPSASPVPAASRSATPAPEASPDAAGEPEAPQNEA